MTKKITRGSTYNDTMQWGTSEYRLLPCTLNATAPVTIDCVGHGLVEDWPVSIENHPRIDESETYPVHVIDADHLELTGVNGVKFAPTRSVVLRAAVPTDMSGYTARMHIRDKVGGTLLLELTTENGGITLDNAAKKIHRTISAEDTAALTVKKAVYDLEMVSGDYVIKIDADIFEIGNEVTV